ncbi:MAG: methyltransferase [Candidatus Micrarchaeota archaeon]|nr:methyltransferase [Candidatus Micrarchaeota archaeon]
MKDPEISIGKCKGAYYPREESWMMADVVKEHAFGKVLDMGCGTGIIGITAAMKGCDVTFSDIVPESVECARINAKTNNVTGKFVVSDMFNNITDKFNTIIFNPPYLPSHWYQVKHIALDGGKDGREYIERFIKEYKEHVLPEHKMLLLESSFNHWEDDLKRLNAKLMAKKHYFFEDVVVLMFE